MGIGGVGPLDGLQRAGAGGAVAPMKTLYLVLADAILIVHAAVVLFNVVSLPLIWIGHFRRWRFVRNFYFRALHLGLMGVVALQALANEICPLTTWEYELRLKAGESAEAPPGFIAHWIQRVLYHDADPRVFTAAYVGFFVLVLATAFWVKPDPPRRRQEPAPPCSARNSTPPTTDDA